MNRIEAVVAIADNFRDVVMNGNPVSLTGSTLQMEELVQPLSTQLRGFWGYVYGAGIDGQERVVGSFNPAANEVVFPQVFTTTPSLNSTFLLFEEFRKTEYDSAINRFVGIAQTRFLEDKTATLALVATQYEYAVPSGFEWISTLRFIPSSNSDYGNVTDVKNVFELPPRFWRIEANDGGSYVIAIDARKINLDEFDNQLVRVMGQAKPDISPTDNAVIHPDLEEFIIAGASMLLASQRISENQEWRSKFIMFRDNYRPLEDYISRHGHGKKVT